MRRLLTKLDGYLREHPIAIGHIDANPSPHLSPFGNGREEHRLARSSSTHKDSCPVRVARRVIQPLENVSDEPVSSSKFGGHTSEGRGEWVACRCRLIPLHFTIFHFVSQVFTFIAYSTRESFLAFMRVFCQAQDYAQAQNRRAPRQRKGQFAHEILSYKRQRKSVSPAAGHLFRRSWPIPPVA